MAQTVLSLPAASVSVTQLPAALGTGVMAGAMLVTIATDDTLMAAIKLDVDKIPSKGTAAMAGSTPMTVATDDTVLGPQAASSTPFQVTLGASALLSATQTQTAKKFIRISALVANGNPAYIKCDAGTASATAGDELLPGQTKDYPISSTTGVAVFGTASDKINVTVF